MKKSALFAALLGSALLLGACGGNTDKKVDKEVEEESQIEDVEASPEEQGAVDKSETATSDEAMKESFAEEEGVSSVGIIVTEDGGGFVLVDFEVTAEMKEEQATELASKFAEIAKEKYPDHQVDVQARKSGTTFAGKTIE